jgi:acyl dehydratase
MCMMCDPYLLDAASLGLPGLDGVKRLVPVRPGDTLRVRFTVLETSPLESNPNVGLFRSHGDILNQKDECVAEMEGYGMFRRRPVQDV